MNIDMPSQAPAADQHSTLIWTLSMMMHHLMHSLQQQLTCTVEYHVSFVLML